MVDQAGKRPELKLVDTRDERAASGQVRRVKLAIPPPPLDAIARPALIARLDAASRLPLTRVIAGAGYGKTTLLADWARQASLPVAWLSLDSADCDLGRFAAHLAAAIQSVAPEALPGVKVLLSGGRALDPAAFADVLADDLLDLDRPLALVLDDLHVIAGSAPERTLDLLFVHPPPSLRLIIGSRGEPDLPQGTRLFGRGLVAAIGAADLRFSPEQTAAFLPEGDTRSPAELTSRSDGWAAGIRALAVAGPGAASLPATLQTLLHADVLASQPPELARFLADLAVAERISPGLAAALSTEHRSEQDAAALLAEAERRGLFVTRLDERGAWWRLHPLLREALVEDDGGEAVRSAHARASAWFAGAGMVEEAIDHAIRADRLDEVGDLLAIHAAAWLDGAVLAPVDWIDRLPAETLRRHPVLLVAKARASATRMQFADARSVAAEAAAILDARDPEHRDPALRPLRQELLVAEAHMRLMAGETRPLRATIEPILFGQEPATPRLRADISGAYVFGLAMDGRTGEAIALLQNAARGLAADDPFVAFMHPTIQGLRIRALDCTGAEESIAKLAALPDLPYLTRAQHWRPVISAAYRHEQGDFAGAIEAAREALAYAPGVMIYAKTSAAVRLVESLLALGRIAEARAAIADLSRLIELSGAESLAPIAGALTASADLAAGDLSAAARWAGPEPRFGEDGAMRTFPHPVITQARTWLARNQPGDAERATAALERLNDGEASIQTLLDAGWALPLLAVAHARLGQTGEARAAMRDALSIEPGRMTQRFAGAGPEGVALLQAIAASRGDDLALRASAVLAVLGRDAAAAPLPPPFNPLSRREVEILALMAEWRTNKEIAESLDLGVSTINSHAVRIFRKLGVGDRRDAVEAARAAGWLPD